ncbi:MAG: electron transfer flavoprotein subunit beta/FixA family protein [Bacteriovoracaceae bacterium]|nr:electron transfer flavoprotein subunit beta/FixA family protein [Bacteriovoracaceae bacterium]
MSLKMIVTVKQVPDTHNIVGDAMKPDGTVNRAVLPTIFNPEDLNALEEALSIKETVGGSITVITMGPPKAVEVLKESLYRGADDVVLISDRKFAGADTLATSYALKCAIEKLGDYDLVLCGRQAIDGDTAQVGPQIAEKLGINQITGLVSVLAASKKSITIKRQVDDGFEIVRSKYPLLVTVNSTANEPRSPRAKRVMAYKNIDRKFCDESYVESYLGTDGAQPSPSILSHIREWNVESIGADALQCGLSGSPTKVKKVQNIVLTTSDVKQVPNTDVGISEFMRELMDEHIIG